MVIPLRLRMILTCSPNVNSNIVFLLNYSYAPILSSCVFLWFCKQFSILINLYFSLLYSNKSPKSRQLRNSSIFPEFPVKNEVFRSIPSPHFHRFLLFFCHKKEFHLPLLLYPIIAYRPSHLTPC